MLFRSEESECAEVARQQGVKEECSARQDQADQPLGENREPHDRKKYGQSELAGGGFGEREPGRRERDGLECGENHVRQDDSSDDEDRLSES